MSDGGLLVAVAEMAMAGGVGAELLPRRTAIAPHAYWFGEDQGRYVLAVADSGGAARGGAGGRRARAPARHARAATGLTLPGADAISLETLREAHERFFPAWMRS